MSDAFDDLIDRQSPPNDPARIAAVIASSPLRVFWDRRVRGAARCAGVKRMPRPCASERSAVRRLSFLPVAAKRPSAVAPSIRPSFKGPLRVAIFRMNLRKSFASNCLTRCAARILRCSYSTRLLSLTCCVLGDEHQYSSSSMIVMTRSVTEGSAGSGE
jgi:hypothetical protein